MESRFTRQFRFPFRSVVALLLLQTMTLNACAPGRSLPHGKQEPRLQALVEGELSESVPGVLLHVDYPDKRFFWSGAAGVSDRESKQKLQADQPFRIASVTKTFVASAILRLWEDQKLALDDPIIRFIAPAHVALLRQGGYAVEQITIRHLLTHSSGLFDHTNTKTYLPNVLKNPTHRWTRTEQITEAVTGGKPVGQPGERFSYSDTGYILLGEIIETITQKSLNDALRDLLSFKRLGLIHTAFENTSGRAGQPQNRLHQYIDGTDTYRFDPSIDLYGGGGLLSTTADLTRFYQALFSHRVFRQRATLDTMLMKRDYATEAKMDYRMGIYATKINGLDAFTHAGYWGTQVVYIPTLKLAMATNYSQFWAQRGNAPILANALTELQNGQ